jgi:2-dehydro-3-deoxygluconokinase
MVVERRKTLQDVRDPARVACIGECMVELRERPDGLLSRGFGGDTLNTALYLARLGLAVDYITVLGTDHFSDAMLAAWQAEGIGTGNVLRLPDCLPGLYLIQTDPDGERRFAYWRDSAPARRLFDPPQAALVEAALLRFDVIYLSGITLSLFGPAARARLFDSLDRFRSLGGCVVFDTNFRQRGWPDHAAARLVYSQMMSRSDVIFASVEDHALLFATADKDREVASRSAECWLEGVVPEIVLKLEAPECRIFWAGGDAVVSAVAADPVVDTTAAGDSFAAGYMAARLQGDAPHEAAAEGHRLARIVVGHPGAIIPQAAMPPRRDRPRLGHDPVVS